jgi:hypothetical protein
VAATHTVVPIAWEFIAFAGAASIVLLLRAAGVIRRPSQISAMMMTEIE